jgi:hypothetical protein
METLNMQTTSFGATPDLGVIMWWIFIALRVFYGMKKYQEECCHNILWKKELRQRKVPVRPLWK